MGQVELWLIPTLVFNTFKKLQYSKWLLCTYLLIVFANILKCGQFYLKSVIKHIVKQINIVKPRLSQKVEALDSVIHFSLQLQGCEIFDYYFKKNSSK